MGVVYTTQVATNLAPTARNAGLVDSLVLGVEAAWSASSSCRRCVGVSARRGFIIVNGAGGWRVVFGSIVLLVAWGGCAAQWGSMGRVVSIVVLSHVVRVRERVCVEGSVSCN